MLATTETTLEAAIDDLDERIDTLSQRLDELAPDTAEADAVGLRLQRLEHFQRGLRWQRDEVAWPADATLELGAPTAGEAAMLRREMPADVDDAVRQLWFVAATTETAPYVDAEASLEETFETIAGRDIHPGFVDWAEAQANACGVPGEEREAGEGNADERSETPSSGTATSDTSTTAPNSST